MGVCSCTEREEATKIQNKPNDEYTKNMKKLKKIQNDEESDDDDLKRNKTAQSAVSAILEGAKEGDTFRYDDGSEFKVVMLVNPHKIVIKCLICDVNISDIELTWHTKNAEHIMNCSEKCAIF